MAFVPGQEHDAFVSYAHIDNEPLSGAVEGWVTTLQRNLETVVRQKLGDRERRLSIWIDHELAGNRPFAGDIDAALQRTATLLVILSPGYLASDWCRREREAFRTLVQARIRAGSRVFIVHRDRVDPGAIPSEFGGLLGYRFWIEDGPGRVPRTLGVPVPTPAETEYYSQINQLGTELAAELLRLKELSPQPAPVAQGPAVFLAEVTDDLETRRDEVRRYLSQAGVRVLPTVFYPRDDGAAFEAAMTSDLAQCKLFVQLLSGVVGRKPPPAPNGFPALQYELALRQGLPIMQWRARDIDVAAVEDGAQRGLLDQETVRACAMEEFKQAIVDELRRAPAPPKPKPSSILVFLNTDGPDRQLAEQIGQYLVDQGVGYTMPLQEGSPEEVRSDLEDNLLTCDGLMLVYGASSAGWVRSQLRQCRKVISQRDQPLAALAVFEGPPPDKVGLDLVLPNLQRLDCRGGLSDASVQQFLSSFRG